MVSLSLKKWSTTSKIIASFARKYSSKSLASMFHKPALGSNFPLVNLSKNKRFLFFDDFRPVEYGQDTIDVSTFLSLFNGHPFEIRRSQAFRRGNEGFAQKGCCMTAKTVPSVACASGFGRSSLFPNPWLALLLKEWQAWYHARGFQLQKWTCWNLESQTGWCFNCITGTCNGLVCDSLQNIWLSFVVIVANDWTCFGHETWKVTVWIGILWKWRERFSNPCLI